jgi:predicted RNA-binding Zn ribbon-like protein
MATLESGVRNLGLPPLSDEMGENAKTLRRWLTELGKQNMKGRPNYTPLSNELNRELDGFSVRQSYRVDPRLRQFVATEETADWQDQRVGLAFIVAKLFDGAGYKRIRICKECSTLFASPSIRGPRRDFCSSTHGNSFKMRAYRERLALQEKRK